MNEHKNQHGNLCSQSLHFPQIHVHVEHHANENADSA